MLFVLRTKIDPQINLANKKIVLLNVKLRGTHGYNFGVRVTEIMK
jgi:hypothetical protein